MLSIAKINSASNQLASGGAGYSHYLGGRTTRQRSDFDDYARRPINDEAPAPFWACRGPALLGLDAIAEAEHVERLAKGFHPVTGEPLVRGAGAEHVMGLDMTFSAPKDVSAVFAGADQATRAAIVECIQGAARSALDYAEAGTVTRHGQGGRLKQFAEAAIASCYTHFASRALDPQLHVHAFMFNLGKRREAAEWSAVEQRPQFDRKIATGILFRVELAHRLRGLGFDTQAAGPYFTIAGISEEQRLALSCRSREIAEYIQERGMAEADSPAAREIAALNTRIAKAEPGHAELMVRFTSAASALGLTPSAVQAMRSGAQPSAAPLQIDHAALLEELMQAQSCATAQEALALICERAMGQWSADRCLRELDAFLSCPELVPLGRTEHLTEVFTSKATLDLEEEISRRVADGAGNRRHAVRNALVDQEFDRLERELQAKLGVSVSLDQQRAAALHIACETGSHAFVEGWAGTGKTTMLRALGIAYGHAGFKLAGCCQSAAAAQNLARETGIASRTIASLLLALREGRANLDRDTVLVLDEAGMVGSREFSMLQREAMAAGAKLVCVGDPKQLQPIEAGGIFGSLMRRHGRAEISAIQRQRTDFGPLLDWLAARPSLLSAGQIQALREAPEDARMQALGELCEQSPRLRRAFDKWRSRFDHEWMREAVELFANGRAVDALDRMDGKGRLRLGANAAEAIDDLVAGWAADKTDLQAKAMIAATRAEVAELNRRAREILIERGQVDDTRGIDIEITHRDETRSPRRFAPGDRIVFTMNNRALGVSNGVSGFVRDIEADPFDPALVVELDEPNERNERRVRIPTSFGRFDLGACLTNHKSQGRTFDSAHVLANPSMCDREWTYVAASRSRFATTLYVNTAALGLIDPESHRGAGPKGRAAAIAALATRMARSRAKGTSLDYEAELPRRREATPATSVRALDAARAFLARLRTASQGRAPELERS